MENASAVCLVLTSWPDDSSVAGFARGLVEARLAACVHVLDAGRSTYRWRGAVEDAVERQVVIKTTRDRVEAVTARLHEAHPYDLPEVLVCDAEGGRAYAAWIHESVASDAPTEGNGPA